MRRGIEAPGTFVCGPWAERLGAVRMGVVTELCTGVAILAFLPLTFFMRERRPATTLGEHA